MIDVTGKGDFKKTRDFLNRVRKQNLYTDFNKYGELGVAALSKATPVDTRLTAQSWKYRIVRGKNHIAIEWYNTNKTSTGTPIAVLVQYGHATRSGSYVQGRDFINPAMRPVFDKIADDVWKKVKT